MTKIEHAHAPWFYDPFNFKFDRDVWNTLTGSASVSNGTLRLAHDGTNALKMLSTTLFMGGSTTFEMTVPSAPGAGHDRIWGFYSPGRGNRHAAYFYVQGSNFYVRTYGTETTPEQTTVTWNSAWTNARVQWKIKMYSVGRVEFWAGNQMLARHTHQDRTPKERL